MRRTYEGVLPLVALGHVGAVPMGQGADCIRRCLAALRSAPLDRRGIEVTDGLEAYAEEVALPALEAPHPDVGADIDALAALGP